LSKIIKARFVINENKAYLSSVTEPQKTTTAQVRQIAHYEREDNHLTQEAADALYHETKVMLEELVAQAQIKADDIILKAKEEAQILVETAAQESQVIRDDAYREGYAEGEKQGLEKVESEIKPLYRQVLSLIEEINRDKENLYKKREKDVVELVLAITEKVLGTVVEAKPEIICHIVKNSLEQVRDAEKIIVKVNPIHIPYLSGYEELFKDIYTEKLQIVDDPAIEQGDCQIVTENGFLDSIIEEQIVLLRQALLEVVEHAGI